MEQWQQRAIEEAKELGVAWRKLKSELLKEMTCLVGPLLDWINRRAGG